MNLLYIFNKEIINKNLIMNYLQILSNDNFLKQKIKCYNITNVLYILLNLGINWFALTFYMRKNCMYLICMFVFQLTNAQNAKLIINNNAFISIRNGANLIIDNGSADAIQVMGTGGNIVSEGEANKLSWSIGTNTGVYAVPFSNQAGEKIPIIFEILSSGTGSGKIDFSTYGGSDWDNNNFRPSDVSHMLDIETGSVNNSAFVIDRFWIIEADNYTNLPTSNMSFTYLESEISGAGNTINEGNLKAQRFNSVGGSWGDMLPEGIVDINSNTVNDIMVSPANFFRSWTLVDYSHPLPVQLLKFKINCQSDGRLISWETASESNNNFFTIEKSFNGQHYSFFKKVNGAGNSSTINFYSITDQEQNSGLVYYRLSQTDFDGTTKIIANKTSNCQNEDAVDFNAWAYQSEEGLVVTITLPRGEPVNMVLYDGIGKLIYQSDHLLTDGNNKIIIPVNQLSTSIYLLKIKTEAGFGISLKNFIKKDF